MEEIFKLLSMRYPELKESEKGIWLYVDGYVEKSIDLSNLPQDWSPSRITHISDVNKLASYGASIIRYHNFIKDIQMVLDIESSILKKLNE